MNKAIQIDKVVYRAKDFRFNQAGQKWADVEYWSLGRWHKVADPRKVTQVAERMWTK